MGYVSNTIGYNIIIIIIIIINREEKQELLGLRKGEKDTRKE